MQLHPITIAAALLLTALPVVGSAAEPTPPNIVFVLADDLGWTELGCYGNDFNETPHLDRVAAEGLRFTQAYAAAPVCSPYRASFLSGQVPARHGILDYLRPDAERHLPTTHVTIAEVLKKRGYATGMIGKWHLSGYRQHGAPIEVRATDHGFDEEIATEVKSVGNGANFYPYVFRRQKVRWLSPKHQRLPGREYLVDRMNLEAVEFIERHRKQPFFLFLSHFAPHTILNGRDDLVEKYRRKHAPGKSTRTNCYLCQDAGFGGDPLHHWAADHNPHLAAMLESIDEGVGMILAKLEEFGLDNNTLLVFTSDNGGEHNVTSNAPLRGAKSQLYEGGIRVPCIIRWPGRVRPGRVCRQPTVNVDFYPTLAAVTGAKLPTGQELDGVSILPLLVDPRARLERDTFYWHYPLEKPHFLGGRSSGAIRRGDWKLIEFFEDDRVELYHLADDVGEARNEAASRPELAGELRAALRKWRQGLGH